MKKLLLFISTFILILAFILSGCMGGNNLNRPSPSPSSLPTTTPSSSPAVPLTPTDTPTSTSTSTSTATSTSTKTPALTVTPTVTKTPTLTPTVTPTVTKTPTLTPTVTLTVTKTPTLTPTVTPTVTKTPTPSPTPSLPAPFSVMIRVPGTSSFPTGSNDSGICATVNYPYYIAQTEVTYQQWSIVYDWAILHGYTFANPGSRGGYYNTSTYINGTFTSGHETDPVTTVNWRDAIVWCNALTEYHNSENGASLDCVYKSGGNPIRNATDAATCDTVIPDTSAKGFRLPFSMEWELAARWRGTDPTNTVVSFDNPYFTKGNSASGATAACVIPDNLLAAAAACNAVAWYSGNSNLSAPYLYSTQPVGGKIANALNLWDMSGNVWEWCFDNSDSNRLLRGGSWYHPNTCLHLAFIYTQSNAAIALNDAGFRFVRTE